MSDHDARLAAAREEFPEEMVYVRSSGMIPADTPGFIPRYVRADVVEQRIAAALERAAQLAHDMGGREVTDATRVMGYHIAAAIRALKEGK